IQIKFGGLDEISSKGFPVINIVVLICSYVSRCPHFGIVSPMTRDSTYFLPQRHLS
uniref:Uncharacterized protein n=1 Tax=Aegilops tauschii subsp. strangulata TaxID=200361 RepID=A0A453HB34_AEGTS